MTKIPVAVLGATGNIGQRFVSLLQDHPFFEPSVLCSSDRKVGGLLADYWRLEDVALDPEVGATELRPLDAKILARSGVAAAFSALPTEVAGPLEAEAARAGIKVFSNASSHRMSDDVPLLVPEVNPDHLALVERQATYASGGFLAT